jgi:hypothetical protein
MEISMNQLRNNQSPFDVCDVDSNQIELIGWPFGAGLPGINLIEACP